MHLIQILLPLEDDDGPFPAEQYDQLEQELTDRFGGVTSFSRSPAEGRWKQGDADTEHDDIVVLEVMTKDVDRAWWAALRERLTKEFRQDELVIRCQPIERL